MRILSKIYPDNEFITAARASVLAYARCLNGLKPVDLIERHLDTSESNLFNPLRRAVVWSTTSLHEILPEDLRYLDAYIQTPPDSPYLFYRTESISLQSPIAFDGYPPLVTHLDLKGCFLYREEFVTEEPTLVPHLGGGFSNSREVPDPEGNLVDILKAVDQVDSWFWRSHRSPLD